MPNMPTNLPTYIYSEYLNSSNEDFILIVYVSYVCNIFCVYESKIESRHEP